MAGEDADDADRLRPDEAGRIRQGAAERVGERVADPDALTIGEAVQVGHRAEVGDVLQDAGLVAGSRR